MKTVAEFLEEHPEFREFADLLIRPPSWEEATEEFPELTADGELRETGMYYTRQPPMTRLALYMISRKRGSSHSFASACACQAFPRAMTDDVFWGGRKHFAEVYGERYFNEVKQALRNQGVELTAHDEYLPELAEYKGDPRAVVSRSQGRSYIKRVCEERGLGCEGGIRVKAKDPASDPLAPENCVDMADDVVAENFERFSAENPDEARKIPKGEIKAAMVDKFGAKT